MKYIKSFESHRESTKQEPVNEEFLFGLLGIYLYQLFRERKEFKFIYLSFISFAISILFHYDGVFFGIPVFIFFLQDILKVKKDLFVTLNREPTIDEIAEVMSLPANEVERIITSAQTPASLDRPISDNGDEEHEFKEYLVDSINPAVDEEVFTGVRDSILESVIDRLSFRERKIIEMRYGLENRDTMTLEDIGRAFNITKERVRQIEVSSLEKMRKMSIAQPLRDFD